MRFSSISAFSSLIGQQKGHSYCKLKTCSNVPSWDSGLDWHRKKRKVKQKLKTGSSSNNENLCHKHTLSFCMALAPCFNSNSTTPMWPPAHASDSTVWSWLVVTLLASAPNVHTASYNIHPDHIPTSRSHTKQIMTQYCRFLFTNSNSATDLRNYICSNYHYQVAHPLCKHSCFHRLPP